MNSQANSVYRKLGASTGNQAGHPGQPAGGC
jgi:hypothetical protein